MLKSILVSLAAVGGITAKNTTTTYSYAYDAPDGCNTSLSYQSCIQPATAVDDCAMSDTPCSCSGEDLNRKCQLEYCSGVSYTRSLWMNDCTSLGYSYIDTNGEYITEPASASAIATESPATETGDSSAATDAASSAASSASSKASAGAGSPTSGSSPTSPADATASSKPNDAGRAMGFPAGGMLAILATRAGTLVGMLLL